MLIANGISDHPTISVKDRTVKSEKHGVSKQARQLPSWILAWFYATAAICTWDASFIMLRPHSLPGGYLAWLWYPYKLYIVADQRYQDTGDAFVFAQSLLNYVEVVLNIVTIVMHYRLSRHTTTTAFTVSVMTFWKTVLYFLMFSEFCTGGVYRQGNTVLQEIFIVFIPNGVWIVTPFAAMVQLWFRLVQDQNVETNGNYKFQGAVNGETANGSCQKCSQAAKQEINGNEIANGGEYSSYQVNNGDGVRARSGHAR